MGGTDRGSHNHHIGAMLKAESRRCLVIAFYGPHQSVSLYALLDGLGVDDLKLFV